MTEQDHYATVYDAALAMLESGESFDSLDDAVAAAEAEFIVRHPEADR